LKVFVSLLVAVCCLLVAPAVASAVTYTVDSTGDQVDETVGSNGCKTSLSTCTLRAAIEESNFSTGVTDEIKFAATFNGQLADTIAIATSLPAIKDPVHVDGDSGGQCATEAGVNGPCVGVNGPAAGSALTVENANGVEIEGLAITGVGGGGGAAAINAINGSATLELRDNWLGVKLDGSAGTNNKGIFLDPESNSATIGGIKAADRNVIANNSFEGLDIEGADNADVLGNYFGVKPDGATRAANGKNIEITDTIAFEANGDEVGTTVEGAAVTTQACDGGCNVISGSNGSGVDLVGDGIGQNELPASGPTTVRGNYVGLNSGGVTTVVTGALFDILAGAAEDVTVGGVAAGDANYIAGGSYGIYQENSDGFKALGNVIGRRPGGAGIAATGTAGIFLFSLSSTGREAVEGNTIRLDGGVGIEQRFGGADIAGNAIEEGQYGILTYGSPAGAGSNVIEENAILNAELNAVLIKNENNLLVGNLIEGAGLAAIRLEGPEATGTLIGGDAEAEENEISGNGGDAIEVVDPEATDTQIKRNFGAGNGGLFIDLGANGPGNSISGPNDGIQAPSIGSAKLTGASGSGALPGAEVRVFRKATSSAGEIESFLGEAKADGSGNWSVTYAAAIPGETRIAATQSALEGTSELAFATTEPAPKAVEKGTKEQKEKQPEQKKPKGTKKPKAPKGGSVPETTITKGPRGRIHSRGVRFKFVSSVQGSKFECKLDRQKFKPCKSPKSYKRLKPGKHVFKVRALKGKNVDPTPAKRKFKVLK
jgi:hypothetical protein